LKLPGTDLHGIRVKRRSNIRRWRATLLRARRTKPTLPDCKQAKVDDDQDDE
jgi:hypothetical protein